MSALHILYVDDDADIRAIVALSLSLDPAIILTQADSGRQALDLVATGLEPDVVVLDVMMPDLDGPAVLARLQTTARGAAPPVIFMSAREGERGLAERGAIGAIGKPFDPLSLAGEIRRLLAGVGATRG